MKAAIYSRKSKFTGKGESIENQVQLCREYGGKNLSINEFEIYEDEGFSGKNIDRPEFQRLLKDAREKKFNCLICYRLDRISRNIADFSILIDELQSLNISFISIREQFDTSTPMGRAMMYIASVFAQLERETIAERIRDNMIELAKTGRWLGGQTPFGFKSEAITYLDSEMKERKMFKLSPIPLELKTVSIIYDKYLETSSIRQTLKYLFTNNYKTKLGVDWDTTKVLRILNNPIYVKANIEVVKYLNELGIEVIGNPDSKHALITYNKTKNIRVKRDFNEWIAAVSKHEGLIDSDKWLLVQKILKENKSKAPRIGTSSSTLLSGIIKCAYCGKSMKISYGHKNKETNERYKYYVCNTKDISSGKRCSNPNVNVDEIEEIVIQQLKSLTSNKIKILNYLKIFKTSTQDTLKIDINKADNLNKRIKEKENQIQNLVTQLSLDTSISKYIIPEIQKLSYEIDVLKLKMSDINNNIPLISNNNINASLVLQMIDTFNEIIDSADFENKKYIISALVDSIFWNGKTGEVEIKLWGADCKN